MHELVAVYRPCVAPSPRTPLPLGERMNKLEMLGRLALHGDEDAINNIRRMHTIEQGHTDNLKADDGRVRLWVSRMTVADGAPCDNQISIWADTCPKKRITVSALRTISEIEQILNTYQGGPILPAAAKELLKHYKALESAFVAETDGLDPEVAKRRFLVGEAQ